MDLAIALRSIGKGEDGEGSDSETMLSDSAVSMHDSEHSSLPVNPSDVKLDSKFLLSEDAIHEGEADGSQPAVLVVDDNQVLLRLSVIMMRSFGYAVTSAVNGSEALHLMKHRKFDVVFIDIDMPVMRGDEAVRQFRNWEKKNRAVDERATIVMMSGNVEERDIRSAIADGANDFVTKPFAPEVLDRHVRQACGVNAKSARVAQVR